MARGAFRLRPALEHETGQGGGEGGAHQVHGGNQGQDLADADEEAARAHAQPGKKGGGKEVEEGEEGKGEGAQEQHSSGLAGEAGEGECAKAEKMV